MFKLDIFRKFNKNNKGMSLVEAIIAVCILSVAVIPVLAVFSNTVRYNALAKVKQRATNTGMSVMESFKAYGVIDSKEKFDAGTFLANGNLAGVSYDATEVDDKGIGKYCIKNVSFSDSSEAKKFTVEINVEPYQVMDAAIEGTPFINPVTSVSFSENPKEKYDPYAYVNKFLFNDSAISDEVKGTIANVRIKRDINVEILPGANNHGKVNVSYTFSGKYDSSDGNDIEINIPDAYKTVSETYEYSEESDTDLEDVFLYFYPTYKGLRSVISNAEDHIYFTNTFKAGVNVYLIKQLDSTLTASTLAYGETNYKLLVEKLPENKINLYDVINKDLDKINDMDAPDNPMNIVVPLGSDEKLSLNYGISYDVENRNVSARITVKVIDEKPLFKKTDEDGNYSEDDKVIVTLYSTILM